MELLASPEVGTYLGGPRPREELEREVPEVPVGTLAGREVERFQSYGAEQWFGLWSPVTPSG